MSSGSRTYTVPFSFTFGKVPRDRRLRTAPVVIPNMSAASATVYRAISGVLRSSPTRGDSRPLGVRLKVARRHADILFHAVASDERLFPQLFYLVDRFSPPFVLLSL